MSRSPTPPAFLAIGASLALLAACASTEQGTYDPELEQERLAKQQREEALAEQMEDLNLVLLNLDKAMDSYAKARTHPGYDRADRVAESLEKYLRTTVDKHFDALVAVADQDDDAVNRARAVGALGFASTRGPDSGIARDILTPLLNALRAEDATVVTNAVFALGVLADSRTPVDALARIIEDSQQPPQTRIGAAWSLLNIQEALHQPQQVQPVWMRLLEDPKANTDPWILIQALRGLGRLRDPALAPVAEPFLQHPTPLVREASAVALGFLGNRDSHRALLARLAAEETNANVRLAVRKALQALAGQVDRGYDVDQWRRVFESDGRS